VSAEPMAFERQVAMFLGGMAEEVALGPRTPPRTMLRRARLHMATSITAAALIVAVAVVLAIATTRGLVGAHGPFHMGALTRGSLGSSGVIVRPAAPGRMGGALDPGSLGQGGLFGGLEGPYGPYGGLGGRRGPDGGVWGRTPSRHGSDVGGSGRGAGNGSGYRGGTEGGSPGSPPRWLPPPGWGGETVGHVPIGIPPSDGWGATGATQGGASAQVATGEPRRAHQRHRRATSWPEAL
jgi:hypothetical protein